MSVWGDILDDLLQKGLDAFTSQGLSGHVSRDPIQLDDLPADQFPNVYAVIAPSNAEAIEYGQEAETLNVIVEFAFKATEQTRETAWLVHDAFRQALRNDATLGNRVDRAHAAAVDYEENRDSPWHVVALVVSCARTSTAQNP